MWDKSYVEVLGVNLIMLWEIEIFLRDKDSLCGKPLVVGLT